MMKPMDGISFTRKIRNDPRSPNSYVPVILMTGFSEKRRVLQARDAGVTEFLVKPFNARDLYKRIAQVIERPRQFVRSDDFFGPDRRRTTEAAHDAPRRRESDMVADNSMMERRGKGVAQDFIKDSRRQSDGERGGAAPDAGGPLPDWIKRKE
jgi:DNA-binding response OmpR family regulator